MSMLDEALAYRSAGWEILPLSERSKIPAISKANGGNGVLDATTDPALIFKWWWRNPNRNVGGRVPAGLWVLDIDPRHGGDVHLRQLIDDHDGEWNRSLTVATGGGGLHIYYEHPGGTIGQGRLPPGVEIKTHAGYVVLPPSIHPNGRPYKWAAPPRPIGPAVPWFVDLLRPVERPPAPPPVSRRPMGARASWGRSGEPDESPADWFTSSHRWADVLPGWHLVSGDGESDGSRWQHPTASSPWSATIQHGLLFNYSPNAGLPVTEPGHPQGLTRFRAWAHLEHWGDLAAAARAAREQMRARVA